MAERKLGTLKVYLKDEMTLKRAHGPYTSLAVKSDMVYGPSFMVHLVLQVGMLGCSPRAVSLHFRAPSTCRATLLRGATLGLPSKGKSGAQGVREVPVCDQVGFMMKVLLQSGF